VRAHGDHGARIRRALSYVRGLSPATNVSDAFVESWTRRGIFGTMPLPNGTYFFSSTGTRALSAAIAAQDLDAYRSIWAEACPLSREVLAPLTHFDDLLINEVIRVDCARWSNGKVTLLGDAAHGMSPNLGQGANSALVDAVVLADSLAKSNDVAQALATYERRRKPAVRRVQDTGDRLASLNERTNPLLRAMRDSALTVLFGRMNAPLDRELMQEDPKWLRREAAGAGEWGTGFGEGAQR